ncbi:hypothetical protein K469DRAFT_579683 [Zopfia rhizophila CBS 207.26]|uniref:Uncharacterized protein n=1 Tax=Zopfia rhizophila CBS 207.26 TaxID=1314779 RepID=A0A6A6E1A2_9PEZI|nr:hypothetical protein K469DRAFT_579683 [Zopfia rhizophila CBS 207.26]
MALLILFILKKNRKLRLYINYRYLNKAIVKNHYLILLILELINKLRGAKYNFYITINYKEFIRAYKKLSFYNLLLIALVI